MASNRQVDVAVEMSGIATILSLSTRSDADQLRSYLEDQRCQVGEVFGAGEFSFFAYCRGRPIAEVVAKNDSYRVVERRSGAE
jgi:hypothetical protein